MKIDAIDAFSDNIIWAFQGPAGGRFVVDPGDASPVLQYLADHKAWLEGVLITHHHQDHVGGLERLQAEAPRAPGEDPLTMVPVFGPQACVSLGVNHPLEHGDRVRVGPQGQFALTLAVPGHTLDHVAYFVDDSPPLLFSGDTLFAGGCGRLLGGTAVQLHASLGQLQSLPDETRIYCAHEYTLSNLQFAADVFPENDAIQSRLLDVIALRKRGQRTLPSSIGLERVSNPFLRAQSLEEFRALRLQKDVYRPPTLDLNPN